MNIFENATNWTKQGDIGEARAIFEYTKMGYVVSRTIFDSAKYDIIIDDGKKLIRVQVKTTTYSRNGKWEVGISRTGGNSRVYTRRSRQDDDYDIIFILSREDECWSIPVEELGGTTIIVLGPKYNKFKI